MTVGMAVTMTNVKSCKCPLSVDILVVISDAASGGERGEIQPPSVHGPISYPNQLLLQPFTVKFQ